MNVNPGLPVDEHYFKKCFMALAFMFQGPMKMPLFILFPQGAMHRDKS
jgi:hypothetical protein